MDSVSIKGIVLGSLFDIASTLIVGVLAGIVVVVSSAGDPQAVTLAASSGGWLFFSTAAGLALTVVAGYLAARVAGRGELVNGFLCAVFTVAIMFPVMADQPVPWSATTNVILYAVTPLLGLLGGYLRYRQVGAMSETPA